MHPVIAVYMLWCFGGQGGLDGGRIGTLDGIRPPIRGLRTSARVKRADDNVKLQIQGRHLFAANVVMAIPR